MVNNDFFIILYSLLIAFFGATCKEINDKSRDSTESFNMFFGEIMLHGFSGWIIGLYSIKYISNDIISITIFSGVGGLMGFQLIKVIYKRLFPDIKDSDLEEEDKNTKDK